MRFPWQPAPGIRLGRYGFRNWQTLTLSDDISHGSYASHKHILGLTGTGKSVLVANLFTQLVERGIAVSLVDPHSDLADDTLSILHNRGLLENVYHIDFGRTDAYLPFNILEQPYARDPQHIAKGIVDAFQRSWPALAGGAAPHFENMLLSGSMVLIANRQPITGMLYLLTDEAYRDMLLKQVTDPQVLNYFHHRFARWGRETADKVESTLNKIYNLTFSLPLRYTLGQADNRLDFRRIIDSGTSVIYDLGGIDSDAQTFLGSLLMLGYEQAALSRKRDLGAPRRQHQLLIDEAMRFADKSQQSMTTMLSETRKYGLFLTMAHQTFSPEDEQLRRSLGNAIRIAFRVNREDALWLAPQLTKFDPHIEKHVISDEHAEERTHPLFSPLQEQYEQMAVELSHGLGVGEAYVKAGGHVQRIKTELPKDMGGVDLQPIKDRYARELMTPADEVKRIVDTPIEQEAVPPRRRRREG
jgi:hypothetical protein